MARFFMKKILSLAHATLQLMGCKVFFFTRFSKAITIDYLSKILHSLNVVVIWIFMKICGKHLEYQFYFKGRFIVENGL